MSTAPYKNPAFPVAERVADLLGRMTLAEKVQQIRTVWVAKRDMIDEFEFSPAKASAAFPDGIGHITRPSDRRGMPGITGAAGGTGCRVRASSRNWPRERSSPHSST